MVVGIDAWGLSGSGRYTGMGHYAAMLLEGIPRLAPEIQVIAYGAVDEPRPTWLPPAIVWRTAFPSIHPKIAAIDSRLRELPRRAAADRLDLFHSPAVHVRPSLPPVPRMPCPLVATVHDVLPLTHYGHGLPLRLRAFYRWNLRRATSADAVVTVSNHSRREILAATRLPDERVSVIYNGVDFAPNHDPAALARAGVTPPFLLYAGSYEPRKNLAGALECYRALVDDGRRLQLVAVVESQSGHAATAHSRLRELGLDGRVRFVHTLTAEDLRALYTQAEVVLFPSLAEGFGLPVIQAGACGAPVVASDLDVLREVAGDAAEFTDPGNPHALAAGVRRVLDSPERRQDLVRAGAARAREFTVDRFVQRHVELYRSVAAAARASSTKVPTSA